LKRTAWIWCAFYLIFLTGCAATGGDRFQSKNAETQPAPMREQLADVPELDGPKITIAVYEFSDKTGQRQPSERVASLSTAVTQGAEVWVIKSLQDIGNGSWFDVVERVGLDNLVKERQLIRNTRENYGEEGQQLQPMRFAGLILEGGIVGYDANVITGGAGARYLGIGVDTQYRVDTVTIVMRLVSVNTGRVLISVATEKTILSTKTGANLFRFFDMGTELVETEMGMTANEPVNYAVRAAIEAGVIEIVYQGEKKELWQFKRSDKNERSTIINSNNDS
jgi:curli production assembly/transport component CsgG